MRCLLGVDVGGSKTHALIADENGSAQGFGCAGMGNYQGVGYEGMRQVLIDAVGGALEQAGIAMGSVIAAGFGIGGFDWPSQLQANRDVISGWGLSCPIDIVNDATLGLVAGTSAGWGLALVGGTGCNCRGRSPDGREGRVTGEGERFGEWGGAGGLVERALQAVSHEWSKRGPHTALSDALLQLTGAADLDQLIEGLDLERYQVRADWAPAVFQIAHAGDAVARQVVAWAGQELGELACAVIRQLGMENEAVEIVQIGGLFDGGPLYSDAVHATILKVAPKAAFVRLKVPPVVGGVLLAAQQAGIKPQAIRARLIGTTEALLKSQA
jgi:N-acetylglucosamine kinase-like BadF-type ATPase